MVGNLYLLVTFVTVLGAIVQSTEAVDFSYDNQAEWPTFEGSSWSCGGNRQSPINVDTDEVEEDDDLITLKFKNFSESVSGIVENNGNSIEFIPNTKNAKFINHRGTYVVQQFHFHWGEEAGEGSEHRIDGSQFDAEIHIVTLKQGADPSDTAGDTFSVIAVFGNQDDNLPISGIWSKIPVPQTFEQEIPASGIKYSELLPSNRDYYYYEGSLTTPLCNETVQWFLLKHPIDIPGEFLASLRQIEQNEEGDPFTFNFRDAQALNDREVLTPEGDDEWWQVKRKLKF